MSQSTAKSEVRVLRVKKVFGCKHNLGLASPLTDATITVYKSERQTRASTKFINP